MGRLPSCFPSPTTNYQVPTKCEDGPSRTTLGSTVCAPGRSPRVHKQVHLQQGPYAGAISVILWSKLLSLLNCWFVFCSGKPVGWSGSKSSFISYQFRRTFSFLHDFSALHSCLSTDVQCTESTGRLWCAGEVQGSYHSLTACRLTS